MSENSYNAYSFARKKLHRLQYMSQRMSKKTNFLRYNAFISFPLELKNKKELNEKEILRVLYLIPSMGEHIGTNFELVIMLKSREKFLT